MCIQTIWIRKYQQEVPCGRCYECVKRRRNDWYIRCVIQSRQSKYVYFGLLTYAEVGDKLVKRDVQLFLKRLRAYGYKFLYLIAGEHGEKKDRPHWHCLFFTDTYLSFAHIAKAWRGGFRKDVNCNKAGWIRFEPIRSFASIRYTVKYLYKYDGVDSRFELMVSKNPAIGKGFLINQRYFLERKTTEFTLDGRKLAMPRYYKRKFFNDYEDIKEEVNAALAAKVAEIAERELVVARAEYPGKDDHELVNIIKHNKYNYGQSIRENEKNRRRSR